MSGNSIHLSAKIIAILRKQTTQRNRTAWVKWRNILESINEQKIDIGEIKYHINLAVGDAKKFKTVAELKPELKTISEEELHQVFIYIALFIELIKQSKETIIYYKYKTVFDELKTEFLNTSLDDFDITTNNWIEKYTEDKFTLKVKVAGTLKIILLDYCLRWFSLWMYQTEVTKGIGDEILGVEDDNAFFIIIQVLIIPVIVFGLAFFRDKYINKKATRLFKELNYNNLKLNIHHSPWNYLVTFLFVISGVFIPFIALGLEVNTDANEMSFYKLMMGIIYGTYLLILIKQFSKSIPTIPIIINQIEAIELKQIKNDLTHDENDDEIVELDVSLRSANEKMETYVLEAALFGALAFSAFLQLVSSDALSMESITLFSHNCAELFNNLVHFKALNSIESIQLMLNKTGLLSLVAYQTLFCAVFFLAVIASRLKFNDLTDSIDRFLNLSKSYNDKEENLVSQNQGDATLEPIKKITKKIRSLLSKGNLTLEETKPIMEYMRFFRTLGISTFFSIIVTCGLFISVQLSFILLFISLLSFLYFKLESISQKIRNLTTLIQEYYFIIENRVHLVAWSAIGIAIILRTSGLGIGNVILVLSFGLLFFHYLFSLFVPDKVEENLTPDDIFGSASSLEIFAKKALKISLAIFFLGYMFKTMHWPGAGPLLVMGSLILTFYFFTSRKIKTTAKWLDWIVSFSLGIAMLGIIFKIQHWSGGSIIRWIALLGILISGLLIYKYKTVFLKSTKRAVIILFSVGVLAQIPFVGWALMSLNLNYNLYNERIELESITNKLIWPISQSGFVDATQGNELDSLRYYAQIFSKYNVPKSDGGELNFVAWQVVSQNNDSIVLIEALVWINESLKTYQEYDNLDTKASILFKLKRYKEAEVFAKAAIDKGKANDQTTTETENLLKDIIKAKEVNINSPQLP